MLLSLPFFFNLTPGYEVPVSLPKACIKTRHSGRSLSHTWFGAGMTGRLVNKTYDTKPSKGEGIHPDRFSVRPEHIHYVQYKLVEGPFMVSTGSPRTAFSSLVVAIEK